MKILQSDVRGDSHLELELTWPNTKSQKDVCAPKLKVFFPEKSITLNHWLSLNSGHSVEGLSMLSSRSSAVLSRTVFKARCSEAAAIIILQSS